MVLSRAIGGNGLFKILHLTVTSPENQKLGKTNMDLSTRYLGFELPHPLVPSASPLTGDLDNLKTLEDAGASMVVLRSLFEEQITHESRVSEHFLNFATESYAEALTYFPIREKMNDGMEKYLDLVQKAKSALSIPVVASLNASEIGGWTRAAKQIEEAGADALELNIYYLATNMEESGLAVERRYIELLKNIKSLVRIPITVKLSPFISSLPHFSCELVQAGAKGLSLFNRFYQPDIDIEELHVRPDLHLSNSHDLRLPLRWISILYGRVDCDLAATSGIHTVEDVVKAVMAGACVTHLCSSLLLNGAKFVNQLKRELASWMENHEYKSLRQMQGSMSLINCPNPAALVRANYMEILYSWES